MLLIFNTISITDINRFDIDFEILNLAWENWCIMYYVHVDPNVLYTFEDMQIKNY